MSELDPYRVWQNIESVTAKKIDALHVQTEHTPAKCQRFEQKQSSYTDISIFLHDLNFKLVPWLIHTVGIPVLKFGHFLSQFATFEALPNLLATKKGRTLFGSSYYANELQKGVKLGMVY